MTQVKVMVFADKNGQLYLILHMLPLLSNAYLGIVHSELMNGWRIVMIDSMYVIRFWVRGTSQMIKCTWTA